MQTLKQTAPIIYSWICPKCTSSVQLSQRISNTQRNCKRCNTEITTPEIDRQLENKPKQQQSIKKSKLKTRIARILTRDIEAFHVVAIFSFGLLATIICNQPAQNTRITSTSTAASESCNLTSQQDATPLKDADTSTPLKNTRSASGNPTALTDADSARECKSPENADSTQNPSKTDWFLPIAPERYAAVDAIVQADSVSSNTVSSNIDLLNQNLSISLERDPDITNLNANGVKCLKDKKFGEATLCFSNAAYKLQSDPALLSNLGFAQTYSGDIDSARKNLYASISNAPQREIAWNDLGLVFLKLHEQKKAAQCFQIGLKVSSGKSSAYLKSLAKEKDSDVKAAAKIALKIWSEAKDKSIATAPEISETIQASSKAAESLALDSSSLQPAIKESSVEATKPPWLDVTPVYSVPQAPQAVSDWKN